MLLILYINYTILNLPEITVTLWTLPVLLLWSNCPLVYIRNGLKCNKYYKNKLTVSYTTNKSLTKCKTWNPSGYAAGPILFIFYANDTNLPVAETCHDNSVVIQATTGLQLKRESHALHQHTVKWSRTPSWLSLYSLMDKRAKA